jgi:hypothetical protein
MSEFAVFPTAERFCSIGYSPLFSTRRPPSQRPGGSADQCPKELVQGQLSAVLNERPVQISKGF